MTVLNIVAAIQTKKRAQLVDGTVSKIFDKLDQNTLGTLLREARNGLTFPDEEENKLALALDRRNYLTHHFFRHHAEEMVHPQGVVEMIDELAALIKVFHVADSIVTPIYDRLWKDLGVADGDIERIMATMEEDLSKRYGPRT